MAKNATRLLGRILTVGLVALLVGALAGVATLYAEVLNNQWVNGAGYVANPGTSGYYIGDTLNAYGISTSTITLYYIYAWARIWHQEPTPPNLLVAEEYVEWYNSTGGTTRTRSSGGYGDRGVTSSFFSTSFAYGSGYYTSYPDYSGSCYNYWSSGNNC